MKLEKNGCIYSIDNLCQKNASIEIVLHNINNKELQLIKNKIGKKIKLILELNTPILDEKEKKYLKNIINPFKHRVKYIKKIKKFTNTYQIIICVERFNNDYQEIIPLPEFYEDTMYTNMKLKKEYTLEELEL